MNLLQIFGNYSSGFAINPGKIWVLETKKQYEMHVQLFDDENHKILITDVSSLSFDISVV